MSLTIDCELSRRECDPRYQQWHRLARILGLSRGQTEIICDIAPHLDMSSLTTGQDHSSAETHFLLRDLVCMYSLIVNLWQYASGSVGGDGIREVRTTLASAWVGMTTDKRLELVGMAHLCCFSNMHYFYPLM